MFLYRRSFFKQLSLLVAGGLSARPKSAGGDVPVEKRSAILVQPPPPNSDFIKADYDLIVVGGGISGTSTAISAARNGLRVALVRNASS